MSHCVDENMDFVTQGKENYINPKLRISKFLHEGLSLYLWFTALIVTLTVINSNDRNTPLWRLSNSRYRLCWSSNPLIHISEVTMSAVPNVISWSSQTQIHHSQVCHTCQHVAVCINCDNACQQSSRSICSVGKIMSVHGCSLTTAIILKYSKRSPWTVT